MTHRTVREVMTQPVVTVSLDTGFKNVAALMAERGVSALPVLGAGGRVPLATRLTRAVDGVVDVVASLSYAVDDSHRPMASDADPR